jgi:hypothetical protein
LALGLELELVVNAGVTSPSGAARHLPGERGGDFELRRVSAADDVILTPGGFEKLVMATSEPAQARTVPPHSDEMPDFARLQAIVAQFGGEILL